MRVPAYAPHPTQFSGQQLYDDYSPSMYNTILTSLPIGAVCLVDRQLRNTSLFEEFPNMYNATRTLAGAVFWKTGFLQSAWMACFIYFVAYYSLEVSGGQLAGWGHRDAHGRGWHVGHT